MIMDPTKSSDENQSRATTTSPDQAQAGVTASENQLQTPIDPIQSTTPEALNTSTNLPVESVYTNETVIPSQPPKSKKKLFIFGFLIFVFLLFIGAAGLTYAVAYEKIKLEKYPDIQKKVASFVMSLPFMPKTPEYILAKSALAHQDVTKQSFDVSLAIESDDLASSIGLSSIDVGAKGSVDYSDPKNLKFLADTSITKEFNFELRKNNKILYFKINKLPAFLLSLLGLKPETFDPVLDKWVAYDTTPLDTEARRSIEDREIDPLSEEYLEENFSKYIDDKVLEKMKLESVTEDGIEMYKISLDADVELIDHFGDKLEAERSKNKGSSIYSTPNEPIKLSEIIKRMNWEMYIDKKDYYTRKVIVQMDMEIDNGDYINPFLMGTTGSGSEKSKMTFAFAMKSDKFGEEVIIDIPQESITFEEFTNSFSEIMQSFYGGLLTP